MYNKDADNSNNIAMHQEKCLSLLKTSDKIRYVGIINKFGRTLSGKLGKNIKPLLSPDQARDEHFIEAVRQQLRNSFNSSLGKTLFTITKNELVTLVLIPDKTQQLVYYLTIDKDVQIQDIMNIIDKINEL